MDIEKFMTDVKFNLLRTHYWYASVLMQLPIVYDDPDVPTLAVGKSSRDETQIRLFVNSQYVEQMVQICNNNREAILGHFTEILKHEVHHLVFGHLLLDFPRKNLGEIACELSVNSYVNRDKLISLTPGEKAGVFPEDFRLASKKSSLEYYRLLEAMMPANTIQVVVQQMQSGQSGQQGQQGQQGQSGQQGQQGQQGQSNQQGQQGQQGQSGQNGQQGQQGQSNQQGQQGQSGQQGQQGQQGQSNQQGQQGQSGQNGQQGQQGQSNQQGQQGQAGQNGQQGQAGQQGQQGQSGQAGQGQSNQQGQTNTLDDHSKWENCKDSLQAELTVKAIVRNANKMRRQAKQGWGDMPSDLCEQIEKFDEDRPPVVPWEVILRNFISSACETVLGYTMKRPSKRYGTRPGTKKDDVYSVAIGIDTSGSIDCETQIKLFFNELYWMSKTGAKITVFEWDTKIHRIYDFKDYDGNIQGRGGTDPTDFLDAVEKRKFDCAIIFTDLCFGKITKDYHYPMLWVQVNDWDYEYNKETCPVTGTILRVNKEHDGFDLIHR